MDFNNGNDGEKLFEQRNESSVLFSLDSLAQVSENSSESERGAGGSGDESGLIDLNTLTAMSSSDQNNDDFGGAPVFNSVKSKKDKAKSKIIIGIVALLIIGLGIGAYFTVTHFQEEQRKKEAEIAQIKANEEAQNKEKEAELQKLREQNQQLISDSKEREANLQKVKEAQEQLQNQKQQDNDGQNTVVGNNGSSNTKTPSKPKDPKAPQETKEPSTPKPSGKGLTADQVKGALQAAASDVGKCAKNGNLVVSMNVNSAGKPTNITAVSGSFKGTSTEKCILTKVSKIKFPESGKGASGVKWNFKM